MILFLRAGAAFLAGALSLVSQLAILRIATNQLSASPVTVSAVLVLALIGLAAGAAVGGQIADRVARPNRLAFFSLGSAALLSMLAALSGTWLAGLLRNIEMPLSLEAICFVAITVFPVNLLLGGVLPALVRSTGSKALSSTSVLRSFGTLYSFETVGAAVGSLTLIFFAIPQIGLRASWLAVAVFVLTASIVSALIGPEVAAKGVAGEKLVNSFGAAAKPASRKSALSRSSRFWLLFAGLFCSCTGMGMELIWQRYLAIFFGSDTHSYAVVATVFLVGLSAGSLLVSRLLRFSVVSVNLYCGFLVSIGLSILLSVWVLKIGFQLESTKTILGWLSVHPLGSRLLVASTVLLLPAILFGMALPILVELWVSDRDSIGSNSGQIYSAVFLGNVLGVVISAVWLIPALGLMTTAIVWSCVCLVTSVLLSLLANTDRARSSTGRLRFGSGIFLAGAGVCGAAFLVNAQFRQGLGDEDSWDVELFAERSDHTVAVIQSTVDPEHKRLLMDGVIIGEASYGVGEKQQMLAHLPLLINQSKKSEVLTIGLGTGILAGELANSERVDSVTCVELSSAIIQSARYFSDANKGVLNSEKLNLVHGDGVRYLRNTTEQFDVIVSDGKSRPGSAANLPFFSGDFYELCARSLSDDGIFVQWVSIRCDRRELESILATFAGSFPFGHVAIANPDSLYLVGSAAPLVMQPDAIDAYLRSDSTSQLRSYGWSHSDDFLSLYWLDQGVVGEALKGRTPNTLDRPVLESYAWESFEFSVSASKPQLDLIAKLIEIDEDSLFNGTPLVEMNNQNQRKRLQSGRLASAALVESDRLIQDLNDDWLDKAADRCKVALKHLPNVRRQKKVASFFRQLADKANAEQNSSVEYSSLMNLAELRFTDAADQFRMANILAENNAHELALDHLYRAVKSSDSKPQYRVALGAGYLRVKKFAPALQQFNAAIETIQNLPQPAKENLLLEHAQLLKGVVLVKLRRDDEGRVLINSALIKYPELQSVYYRHAFN